MPDKKLTDNEIVKALECCALQKQHCPSSCPLSDNYNCQKILFKDTLDLINHQKKELEKNENIIRLADKTIETANAEIERLKYLA